MARILVVSDHPGISTGMGRVHKEIAGGLHRRGHTVESLGWFMSNKKMEAMPWTVHGTQNNYYGSDVFDGIVSRFRPDIVITIGDCWMIRHIAETGCNTRKMFKWIQYVPIDGASLGDTLPPTWIPVFRDADVKVAYTEYGKRIILNSIPELKDEIQIIPHGVDTKVFRPLSKEQIQQLRLSVHIDAITPEGKLKRRTCFLCVARNQFRKNIPEIAKAWKDFSNDGKRDDVVFWPHMMFNDPMGWNMDEVFDITGIRPTMLYFEHAAHAESGLKMMPEVDLNLLYNICDVFVLISGEGFGLPMVEAMACGKPVIALDHSASTELVKGRGELVKVGHYVTGKYSTERPYPDHECLVKAFGRMDKKQGRREDYGRAALKFVTEGDPDLYGGKPLTWDAALDQWEKLVQRVMHPFSKPLKMREVS